MGLDALKPGNTALITGGAAGIGLAAAARFAAAGLRIVLIDRREELFEGARAAMQAAGAQDVLCLDLDVRDRAALQDLEKKLAADRGGIDVLMCNAGVQPGSDIFDQNGTWAEVLDVNLGGIVNTCQTFVPGIIARGTPGLVVNTGSKQGITTPPGDPAYNVSKAGVKVFTESLQHHLRSLPSAVSAHLLVPGFVFTDLTRRGREEQPPGAWTPDETADFMMERLEHGDFYIICPDNEVTQAMDRIRMSWAMGDLTENRPPLSRWHPDWAEAFSAFAANRQEPES